MLFAVYCRDAEGSGEKRQSLFNEHISNVELTLDQLAVAGPLVENGETVGSLLVVKAQSAAEARAFIESDPYFAAGVWGSIEIHEMLAVAGDWVGGAAWKNKN